MGTDVEKDKDEEEGEVGFEYLRLLFDPDRFGFRRVADRILLACLDYHSFVAFKRSCRLVYDYIRRCGLEDRKFRRKLRSDWQTGAKDTKMLTVPSSATHAVVFDNDRRLLCAVDKRVFVFNVEGGGGGGSTLELTFCRHPSRVSCLAVEGDLAVSGDLNGTLIVWQWRTGEVVTEKQMFGRLEALRLRDGFLATGHISKSYDTGCVSVRKFSYSSGPTRIPSPPPPPPSTTTAPPPSSSPASGDAASSSPPTSPSEKKKAKVSSSSSSSPVTTATPTTEFSLDLPVCFSWFGDLYPVADLDFNSKYMAILQWNLTFRGVNTGSVSVYGFQSKSRVVNLSKAGKTTYSRCRFLPGEGNEEIIVTGADDGSLRLWQLPTPSCPSAQCLRLLTSQHQHPVLTIDIDELGCRMISRDLQGDTIVWDIDRLKRKEDENADFKEDSAVLVKETTRSFTTHTALAISSRRFVIGSLDTCVLCYDVWRDRAQ